MSSSSTIAERLEGYETKRLINFLRGDSELSHIELVNQTEMGLRPALELEDYIKKLYDRKARVNLEDVRVKK
ncbi:hypothetical protein RCL_jg18098.t1 [Rhizophagus clarus]|uniref:Uncharacterized protein n=1 Tax=Rhizophagus clarus TaxID=94130 RepID=A0A8H3QMV8_9GLOM|nr:hypothetical protein RCL_jg18098.t1 [Rhizophagus clarus]